MLCDDLQHIGLRSGVYHHAEPDSHVEGAIHVGPVDTSVGHQIENWWSRPCRRVDGCPHALGKRSGEVFDDATPGDMGGCVDSTGGDRPEHRQVTFLELFYDLVYVVIIAQLSHALAGHIDWRGVAGYAFLFVIVWWAWYNGTTYHDLHGNNDIRTRIFTFLQMVSVVAMAIFAHDALGETSIGFALSYAAFQLILTYMWWRTGVHDPDHMPLSRPYTISFLITTTLFVASVFVPIPWRFYMWGIAIVISLLLPLYEVNLGRKNPQVQAQINMVLEISPSLVDLN